MSDDSADDLPPLPAFDDASDPARRDAEREQGPAESPDGAISDPTTGSSSLHRVEPFGPGGKGEEVYGDESSGRGLPEASDPMAELPGADDSLADAEVIPARGAAPAEAADSDAGEKAAPESAEGAEAPPPPPPPAEPKKKARGGKPDYLGRVFGGYELIDRIGSGGMGTVYKGYQKSLDREVAVKLLNPALVDNSEFIKRFEREAKSIAKISHPNIVSVLDFGQSEDGIYYMVIEYVDGTSIARLIAEKLVVPLEDFLPVVIQCLAGLEHVGTHGVIHRDIKPDNVLIDKNGVAKLVDFGLAKDINSNDTDLTAAGSAMGTPAYMSPEQCMGHPLDVRSDIYALGVTAYFALTGEKPFTGKSSFEVMTKQREYMPPPMHQQNPRIDPRVSELVGRMLAKRPHERFATADECRKAWEDLGADLGLIARRSTDSSNRSGVIVVPSEAGAGAPTASHSDLAPVTMSPREDSEARGARWQQGNSDGAGIPAMPDGVDPMLPDTGTDRIPGQRQNQTSSRYRDRGSSQRHERGSDQAHRRHGTGSRRRSSASIAAWTCPSCGFLNNGEHLVCQRCGGGRYQESEDPGTQESHADRLMKSGESRRAASMYAKLAEKAADRRQRSVLRSKEREARRRFEEAHLEQISSRARAMADNGDLRGAMSVIERAQADALSDDGQSSLAELTQQLRRSRFRGFKIGLVILVLLLLAAGAAWYFVPAIRELVPLPEQLR